MDSKEDKPPRLSVLSLLLLGRTDAPLRESRKSEGRHVSSWGANTSKHKESLLYKSKVNAHGWKASPKALLGSPMFWWGLKPSQHRETDKSAAARCPVPCTPRAHLLFHLYLQPLPLYSQQEAGEVPGQTDFLLGWSCGHFPQIPQSPFPF